MTLIPELMDCHVHIDFTFTVTIFISLHKYLFKGPDITEYTIGDPRKNHLNEIKNCISQCYMCTYEAAWRIFDFEIPQKFSSLTCLSVQLPGRNVYQLSRQVRTASSS